MKSNKKFLLNILFFTLVITNCKTTDTIEDKQINEIAKFEVTEEIYQKTFNDVEKIIKELNVLIMNKDFDKWQTYLSKEYKNEVSSQKFLNEMSEKPLLKKNKIKLKTFKDYFNYVIIPSRSRARLDDIVFVDNNTVKAIMIIKNQNTILYLLKKTDNTWKIGL